jgi:hypothetical protein
VATAVSIIWIVSVGTRVPLAIEYERQLRLQQPVDDADHQAARPRHQLLADRRAVRPLRPETGLGFREMAFAKQLTKRSTPLVYWRAKNTSHAVRVRFKLSSWLVAAFLPLPVLRCTRGAVREPLDLRESAFICGSRSILDLRESAFICGSRSLWICVNLRFICGLDSLNLRVSAV